VTTTQPMQQGQKEVAAAKERVEELRREVQRTYIGSSKALDMMMVALLARGHVLLEGVPGVAKTTLVKAFATALGCTARRIQFTPDLLPADITGTYVLSPRDGTFSLRAGPVFANVVLADEINRAPAKVQSALLEAMQERQVTLAGDTRPLPVPFLVLATQNPVELEGTYPLPEAQIDRFMLKVVVGYPTKEEERAIVERMASMHTPTVSRVARPEQVVQIRDLLDEVFVDPKILKYVIDVVFATREPAAAGLPALKAQILYGASPRASIALVRAARARAMLEGRGYVTPHDVKSVGFDVLRHRVITTYEAEAEGLTSVDVVRAVFDTVPVP